MGSMSIWHWAIVAIIGYIFVVPCWRIARKAGFSGWWSLLVFIPFINFLLIWVFASVSWPALQQRK